MTIYLAPALASRNAGKEGTGVPPLRRCDYYPEGPVAPLPEPGRAGNPSFLFCLAPHGVYRAPVLAPRAVSFYLAFSPLPGLPPAVCFL